MSVPDHFGLHYRKPTPSQIEAAAERAYLNNRAGHTTWKQLAERHKIDWRKKVESVIEAALNAPRD